MIFRFRYMCAYIKFFYTFISLQQNVSGTGKELGQAYVNFARNSMDQIRGKVVDELWILNFFELWYTAQMQLLCNWLSERLDHALHPYQCTALAHVVKVNKKTHPHAHIHKQLSCLFIQWAENLTFILVWSFQ